MNPYRVNALAAVLYLVPSESDKASYCVPYNVLHAQMSPETEESPLTVCDQVQRAICTVQVFAGDNLQSSMATTGQAIFCHNSAFLPGSESGPLTMSDWAENRTLPPAPWWTNHVKFTVRMISAHQLT